MSTERDSQECRSLPEINKTFPYQYPLVVKLKKRRADPFAQAKYIDKGKAWLGSSEQARVKKPEAQGENAYAPPINSNDYRQIPESLKGAGSAMTIEEKYFN